MFGREPRSLGFQVFEYSFNADTTKLEYSKEQPVIVYADDTDILSLVLHHYHSTPYLTVIFLI